MKHDEIFGWAEKHGEVFVDAVEHETVVLDDAGLMRVCELAYQQGYATAIAGRPSEHPEELEGPMVLVPHSYEEGDFEGSQPD